MSGLEWRELQSHTGFRGASGDAGGLWTPGAVKWRALEAPRRLARCLFVYPGITAPGWASLRAGAGNEATYMSHGMAYVSAALKDRGHLVWLLDMRACRGWADFARRVKIEDYDVAFLGFLSLDLYTAACALRILKEIHPNRPVIVGGLHVSCAEEREFPGDLPRWNRPQPLHPVMLDFLAWRGETDWFQQKWPSADCVIWNEAEIAACLIAERVVCGESIPKFVNAGIVPDLDATPHADRDLFDVEIESQTPLLPWLPKPFVTVTFGRGCPFRCNFCNVGTQLSSSSVRLIPVAYFMDELEQLRARLGRIGSLMIHDDILLYPKWLASWNEELHKRFGYTPYWCQMRADFITKFPDLIRLMAECGMAWVSIGIESFSQRMLDFMAKGTTVEQNVRAMEICRDLGVNVFCNWMLGLPTETLDDVRATETWLEKLRPGFHSASIYCDYPGTGLWHYITENGLRMPTHYTRSHYPWQWAIKGVDYDLALATRARVTSRFPNKPVQPKFWAPSI